MNKYQPKLVLGVYHLESNINKVKNRLESLITEGVTVGGEATVGAGGLIINSFINGYKIPNSARDVVNIATLILDITTLGA